MTSGYDYILTGECTENYEFENKNYKPNQLGSQKHTRGVKIDTWGGLIPFQGVSSGIYDQISKGNYYRISGRLTQKQKKNNGKIEKSFSLEIESVQAIARPEDGGAFYGRLLAQVESVYDFTDQSRKRLLGVKLTFQGGRYSYSVENESELSAFIPGSWVRLYGVLDTRQGTLKTEKFASAEAPYGLNKMVRSAMFDDEPMESSPSLPTDYGMPDSTVDDMLNQPTIGDESTSEEESPPTRRRRKSAAA